MNRDLLVSACKENIFYKTSFINNDFDKLEKLMNLTLAANEKFNLTAIKDEDSFRELMIYDSLLPLKYFDFSNKTVIDVGTGAGFPGLPLAICSSGNFTLLDSTNKKIKHICSVIDELSIKNVKPVTARIEEFDNDNRESFDFAIARAVAPLNILVELVLPLLKIGGSFIAMKGAIGLEEIELANNAIKKLGGELGIVKTDYLPESKEKRILIEIKKIKATNKKYPRQYGEIKNKPL